MVDQGAKASEEVSAASKQTPQFESQCQKPEHTNPNVLCLCEESLKAIANRIGKFVLASSRKKGGNVEARDISVMKVGAGTFNVAFKVSIDRHAIGRGVSSFVMRVPQRLNYELNDVPVLENLASLKERLKHVKTPELFSEDSGTGNMIGWPYLAMEYLPGTSLNRTWRTLNSSQKMSIAKQLGKMYRDLLTQATASKSGLVTYGPERRESALVQLGSSGWEYASNIDWAPASDLDWERGCTKTVNRAKYNQLCISSLLPQTHYGNLKLALEWRLLQLDCGWDNGHYDRATYEVCAEILEDLNNLGVFRQIPDYTVLCHMDLFPRNIMADVSGFGTAKVSGIIDWDGAIYGPAFVACRPPKWLWRDCYLTTKNLCSTCGRSEDPELEDFQTEPHNVEGVLIQHAFSLELSQNGSIPLLDRMMFDKAYAMARLIVDVACNREIYLGHAHGNRNEQRRTSHKLKQMWTLIRQNPDFQRTWNSSDDGIVLTVEDR
ncbi:hypothetical protein SCUP515_03863 [Seiridium cupressi]